MQKSFYLAPYKNALAVFPALSELLNEEGHKVAMARRGIDEETARNQFPLEHETSLGRVVRLARLIADASTVLEKKNAGVTLVRLLPLISDEDALIQEFKAKASSIVDSWV